MRSKQSATKPLANNRLGRVDQFTRPALFAALALTMVGCDDGAGEAPGAVSPGEAAELDRIAEELDARQLPPEVIPDLSEPDHDLQQVSGDDE